jgi:hypothetical protein
MNNIALHIILLLKYINLYGLLSILLFIQIPDQIWMSLHLHKHHHCGLNYVIHEYSSDCIYEQKFLLHWFTGFTKNFSISSSKFTSIYLLTNFNIHIESLLHDINRNKAPPF